MREVEGLPRDFTEELSATGVVWDKDFTKELVAIGVVWDKDFMATLADLWGASITRPPGILVGIWQTWAMLAAVHTGRLPMRWGIIVSTYLFLDSVNNFRG
jgi:hypothetical protein